jgi:outer membrane autotransporter protein
LLNNDNLPSRLLVGHGARLSAAAPGALGGASADVSVSGATLEIAAPGVVAKDISIDGGALVFAGVAALPEGDVMLIVPAGGSLVLANSSTIALSGARLVSGRQYRLVHPENPGAIDLAADTVFDLGAQNAGLDLANPYVNPVTGDLIVTGINQAVVPGRDVAAIFDALTSAADAVNARAGEALFHDTGARAGSDAGGVSRLWLRGFGSFGDYASHGPAIGHLDTSYGALAGAEHVLKSNRLLFGGYVGHVSTDIKTDTGAKTIGRQPLVGVYSALRSDIFHLSADLLLGRLEADSSRREGDGIVSGCYKADTLSGGVTLGARFGLWKNGCAQPFVSARYASFSYRGQDETGAGAVLLDDFSVSRWQGLAAVRVAHAFGRAGAGPVRPAFVRGDTLTFATGEFSLLAGRRFLISGGDTSVHGVFRESRMDFFSRCAADDVDAFVLGGALTLDLSRVVSLALRYDCELGGNHSRHDIGATLAWSW